MAALLVYLTKEDDQNSFVKVLQNAGYDVKYIRYIRQLDRKWHHGGYLI